MPNSFKIAGREVGGSAPCYIIAEVSCNHEGDFEEAKRIIKAAADAAADAVKLQTYTADTMTRDFAPMPKGTMWENLDMHSLYQKAYTPWEWHADLRDYAGGLGLHLFSTPFDETAVDHLMEMKAPAMKVASFEVVDTKLIEKIAKTNLPVIISNGMTDFAEMADSLRILKENGAEGIALTHCNSGYPSSFDDANLLTIPVIAEMFDVVPGLSSHGVYCDEKNFTGPMPWVPVLEAVKLGAKVIEVHLLMDRDKARALNKKDEGGFDWPFSCEPAELKKMIDMVRIFEKTGKSEYETDLERQAARRVLGRVTFEPTEKERASRAFRPSLWAVQDVKAGESFRFAAEDKKEGNFDSIRPGSGLPVRFTDFIEGKIAARDITAGEPLDWSMIEMSIFEEQKLKSAAHA